jgi:hypothetical protein
LACETKVADRAKTFTLGATWSCWATNRRIRLSLNDVCAALQLNSGPISVIPPEVLRRVTAWVEVDGRERLMTFLTDQLSRPLNVGLKDTSGKMSH